MQWRVSRREGLPVYTITPEEAAKLPPPPVKAPPARPPQSSWGAAPQPAGPPQSFGPPQSTSSTCPAEILEGLVLPVSDYELLNWLNAPGVRRGDPLEASEGGRCYRHEYLEADGNSEDVSEFWVREGPEGKPKGKHSAENGGYSLEPADPGAIAFPWKPTDTALTGQRERAASRNASERNSWGLDMVPSGCGSTGCFPCFPRGFGVKRNRTSPTGHRMSCTWYRIFFSYCCVPTHIDQVLSDTGRTSHPDVTLHGSF